MTADAEPRPAPDAAPDGPSEGATAATPAATPTGPGRRRRWPWIVLAVLVIGGGAGAAAFHFGWGRSRLDRLRDEAAIFMRIGNDAQARRVLEEAVTLAPDAVELSSSLALVLGRLGEREEAVRVLEAALARKPAEPALVVPLAQHLLALERPRDAHAALEPALPRLQGMPSAAPRTAAMLLFVRVALATGATEQAERVIGELLADGIDDATLRAETLRLRAGLQDARGEAELALESLRAAAKATPEDVGVVLALATALERAGRRDEAIEALDAASSGTGERAVDAIPALCDVLIRAGRSDDALALAEHAARLPGGGRAAAAYARGAVALARGDDATAEAEFVRMAQFLPGAAQPRLFLARLAQRRGELDQARASFEEALEIAPGLLAAQLGLLELDLAAGDDAAVRARAEVLLEESALRSVAVRALFASHARDEDPAAGRARMEALAGRFPDDGLIGLAVAVFRVRSGDVDGGVEALKTLIERVPDLPGAFSLLAAAQERQADALEAIEELARLARADPRFAPARLVLAQIYEHVGRRDLARAELDLALKERPDLRDARLARARLARIAGDVDGAIADLTRLRTDAPRDAVVVAALAELQLARDEPGRAADLLATAVQLQPASAPLRAMLGRARGLAGLRTEALAAFEEARRLRPSLPVAHEDGALLLARGDIEGARDAFARAVQATGDLRFAAALGASMALVGDPVAGVSPFEAWRARVGARSAEGAVIHGVLLALAGDARRAVEITEPFAATIPDVVRRGAAEVRRGADGALGASTQTTLELFALAAIGWSPEVRVRAIAVASDRGAEPLALWCALRLGGAGLEPGIRLALARRLVEEAPTEPSPVLLLADAHRLAADAEARTATLRLGARRFPDDARIVLALGMALEEAGEIDGAVEQYRRAAGAQRPNPIALNNVAYLTGRDDPVRRPDAIAQARRASEMLPRGEILDTLGWLLFLDGQTEAAVQTLTRAVSLVPANPSVRYHFARALEARGDLGRARSHLAMAKLTTGRFPEREVAGALEEQLELLLSGPKGDAVSPIVLGASVEVTAATDVTYLRIDGGGASHARLSVAAPRDAGAVLAVTAGGRGWERIAVEAGARVVLPRFRIPGGEAIVAVRLAAGSAGPATVRLDPVGEATVGFESEPNDEGEPPDAIAVGARLGGGFDGGSDRDQVRLAMEPGTRGRAEVVAGGRGDLLVDAVDPSGRAIKRAVVPAGARVPLRGLVAPADGAILLRIRAATALADVSAAPAGEAVDWTVTLASEAADDGASDVEPNDRFDDATPIAFGSGPATGSVGPGDPIDWHRIDGVEAAPISIRLAALDGSSDASESPSEAVLFLELWARDASGTSPLRRFAVRGDAALVVPRWRAVAGKTLLLAVASPSGAPTRRWELILAAGEDGGETEPNDRPTEAEALPWGSAFAGQLEPAGDRDWFALPRAGETVAIRLEAAPGTTVAIVGGAERRVAASFEVDASGVLEVPGVLLPEGEAFVAVASRDGVGRYELTATQLEAADAAMLEIEPNDGVATATAIAMGETRRGRLSGARDRDVLRVDGRRPLLLRATGAAPVVVRPMRLGAGARMVEPGAEVRLTPSALGEGARAHVEVFAADDADGKAATYEVVAERR